MTRPHILAHLTHIHTWVSKERICLKLITKESIKGMVREMSREEVSGLIKNFQTPPFFTITQLLHLSNSSLIISPDSLIYLPSQTIVLSPISFILLLPLSLYYVGLTPQINFHFTCPSLILYILQPILIFPLYFPLSLCLPHASNQFSWFGCVFRRPEEGNPLDLNNFPGEDSSGKSRVWSTT